MDIVLIVHVLAAVLWIGGMGFATTMIFPTIQGIEGPTLRVQTFLSVTQRFSILAIGCLVVIGFTGIMLFIRKGGSDGFNGNLALILEFKIFIWLLFLILFIFAERHLIKIVASHQVLPENVFWVMSIFHWSVLSLSGLAIAFSIKLQ